MVTPKTKLSPVVHAEGVVKSIGTPLKFGKKQISTKIIKKQENLHTSSTTQTSNGIGTSNSNHSNYSSSKADSPQQGKQPPKTSYSLNASSAATSAAAAALFNLNSKGKKNSSGMKGKANGPLSVKKLGGKSGTIPLSGPKIASKDAFAQALAAAAARKRNKALAAKNGAAKILGIKIPVSKSSGNKSLINKSHKNLAKKSLIQKTNGSKIPGNKVLVSKTSATKNMGNKKLTKTVPTKMHPASEKIQATSTPTVHERGLAHVANAVAKKSTPGNISLSALNEKRNLINKSSIVPTASPSKIESPTPAIIALSTKNGAEKSTEVKKRKRKKHDKSGAKPSRPLSAYNLYFKHERTRLLDEDKKKTDPIYQGKVGYESLARIIGQGWKDLPEDKVLYYKNLAAAETENYKIAMDEFMVKQNTESEDSKKRKNLCGTRDDLEVLLGDEAKKKTKGPMEHNIANHQNHVGKTDAPKDSSAVLQKRGRGRPRINSVPSANIPKPQPTPLAPGQKRGRGRPRKDAHSSIKKVKTAQEKTAKAEDETSTNSAGVSLLVPDSLAKQGVLKSKAISKKKIQCSVPETLNFPSAPVAIPEIPAPTDTNMSLSTANVTGRAEPRPHEREADQPQPDLPHLFSHDISTLGQKGKSKRKKMDVALAGNSFAKDSSPGVGTSIPIPSSQVPSFNIPTDQASGAPQASEVEIGEAPSNYLSSFRDTVGGETLSGGVGDARIGSSGSGGGINASSFRNNFNLTSSPSSGLVVGASGIVSAGSRNQTGSPFRNSIGGTSSGTVGFSSNHYGGALGSMPQSVARMGQTSGTGGLYDDDEESILTSLATTPGASGAIGTNRAQGFGGVGAGSLSGSNNTSMGLSPGHQSSYSNQLQNYQNQYQMAAGLGLGLDPSQYSMAGLGLDASRYQTGGAPGGLASAGGLSSAVGLGSSGLGSVGLGPAGLGSAGLSLDPSQYQGLTGFDTSQYSSAAAGLGLDAAQYQAAAAPGLGLDTSQFQNSAAGLGFDASQYQAAAGLGFDASQYQGTGPGLGLDSAQYQASGQGLGGLDSSQMMRAMNNIDLFRSLRNSGGGATAGGGGGSGSVADVMSLYGLYGGSNGNNMSLMGQQDQQQQFSLQGGPGQASGPGSMGAGAWQSQGQW